MSVVPDLTTENSSSHLVGFITTSFSRLVEKLGVPNGEGDNYKTSTEWRLRVGDEIMYIYDYKNTNMYREDLPTVNMLRSTHNVMWHVGGNSDAALPELKRFLDN